MDFFQKIGGGVGALVGGTLSGGVNLVAEVTNSQTLKEAAKEIYQGNQQVAAGLGQVVDGSIDAVTGVLTQNSRRRQQGCGKLKEVAKGSVAGLKESVDFASQQVTEAYEGGKEMDGQRLKQVAKNCGKALVVSGAVVSVLQVGKVVKIKL